MIDLMQLQLEVCGQAKTLPLSSTTANSSDQCSQEQGALDNSMSCFGVCNQLKHFIVEVQINLAS